MRELLLSERGTQCFGEVSLHTIWVRYTGRHASLLEVEEEIRPSLSCLFFFSLNDHQKINGFHGK